MLKIHAASLVVIASIVLCVGETSAYGQPSSDTAASTPRQIRKAERKAARAKKNAHLKELEKNGYQSGDSMNYPQNIQNAQKNIRETSPAPSPSP